jgi:hypothetical protein
MLGGGKKRGKGGERRGERKREKEEKRGVTIGVLATNSGGDEDNITGLVFPMFMVMIGEGP